MQDKITDTNALEREYHSKIPFVYNIGTKFHCELHPYMKLNNGTVKQHIRGPKHGLNYETGKSIVDSDNLNEILNKKIEWFNQNVKFEDESDIFWQLKRKFEFIFPNNPEHVRELLVKHGFEWMINYDIQNIIQRDKREKFADSGAKYLVALMRQNPEKFRELIKSTRSPSIKKAESRHELPSKTPILIPKHSQNQQSSQNEVSL